MRKMLKFRLDVAHSDKYIKWLKTKDASKEFHHVIGRKNNDYLGILVTREEHQAKHKYPDLCFDEDLLKAIQNLIEYVKYLES